ncbi:MAG TPA: hypothetical protein VGO67_05595 [Verrucomicrobiae bacterium]
MKYAWRTINLSILIVSLWGGYGSLSPDRLRHTNPDAVFCLLILVILPLFALVTVHISVVRWKHEILRRPSLSRNPFNWWHDPLQSLFVSSAVSAAMFFGSVCRFPAYGSIGFWTSGMFASMTAGLVIGQAFVYKVYSRRIISS